MSSLQPIFFQGIHFVIAEFKKNRHGAVAIGLTALPALEMGLRGLGNLFQKYYFKKKSKDLDWNIGSNLGGALLYGVCAVNPIPAARLLGATLFVGYSLMSNRKKDDYLVFKCIYIPVDFIFGRK